ncbi:acyl carrier protein [Aliiglaciecola sp. LCG003]|uniref:acyl carrier protein n=1 Tax=Aliiglaciecola sp. LCG003 TaxID=3053655 RepID=UPI00257455B0|nr:acyl carrier protein [Aliiglaciecola sp. LCG003]WJG11191.1 acyl carrier protein [Aliiglaciecola sp. LCG003]
MKEKTFIDTIKSVFSQSAILKNIDLDQDFFDVGASSLTVVDMQLQLEKSLGIEVPTSTLMTNPTINGWASAYNQVD